MGEMTPQEAIEYLRSEAALRRRVFNGMCRSDKPELFRAEQFEKIAELIRGLTEWRPMSTKPAGTRCVLIETKNPMVGPETELSVQVWYYDETANLDRYQRAVGWLPLPEAKAAPQNDEAQR